MNYENAWEEIKDFINKLGGTSMHFAEHEAKDEAETYCAIGGALLSEQILLKMERIKKEMTTVRDDDGQSDAGLSLLRSQYNTKGQYFENDY